MRKSVHITIGVDTILNWTKKELLRHEGLLTRDDGTPLSAIQIYNLAYECKKDGYEVIPVCDNYDTRGYCLGHEIEE